MGECSRDCSVGERRWHQTLRWHEACERSHNTWSTSNPYCRWGATKYEWFNRVQQIVSAIGISPTWINTGITRNHDVCYTHAGLYRYKRLLFGVNSASEQYQYENSTVLAGISGVDNISDDIIVHGPDQETHTQRLHKVLEGLKECHLTPNAEKCQSKMNKLVFMGILLTDKGIGPTEERERESEGACSSEGAGKPGGGA